MTPARPDGSEDYCDAIVIPIAGKPNLLLGAFEVASLGYRAEEFFVSGTATSYAPVGELGSIGCWSVIPSEAADYTTRMVVLTPIDSGAFNGTVLVEWLNVSGGIDAPAEWFMAHREIVREGYAYVAVSAQLVGVEGGASLGTDMSLKTLDPARYARLSHPGDAFSYDIFSQVGRLVGNPVHRRASRRDANSLVLIDRCGREWAAGLASVSCVLRLGRGRLAGAQP